VIWLGKHRLRWISPATRRAVQGALSLKHMANRHRDLVSSTLTQLRKMYAVSTGAGDMTDAERRFACCSRRICAEARCKERGQYCRECQGGVQGGNGGTSSTSRCRNDSAGAAGNTMSGSGHAVANEAFLGLTTISRCQHFRDPDVSNAN
jgi:hypothetical protein